MSNTAAHTGCCARYILARCGTSVRIARSVEAMACLKYLIRISLSALGTDIIVGYEIHAGIACFNSARFLAQSALVSLMLNLVTLFGLSALTLIQLIAVTQAGCLYLIYKDAEIVSRMVLRLVASAGCRMPMVGIVRTPFLGILVTFCVLVVILVAVSAILARMSGISTLGTGRLGYGVLVITGLYILMLAIISANLVMSTPLGFPLIAPFVSLSVNIVTLVAMLAVRAGVGSIAIILTGRIGYN